MFKFLFVIIVVLGITCAKPSDNDSQSDSDNKKDRFTSQSSKANPNQIQFLEETPMFISNIKTENNQQSILRTLRSFKAPNDAIVFGQGQYGNYSNTDPDGKLHMVAFKADEHGKEKFWNFRVIANQFS